MYRAMLFSALKFMLTCSIMNFSFCWRFRHSIYATKTWRKAAPAVLLASEMGLESCNAQNVKYFGRR